MVCGSLVWPACLTVLALVDFRDGRVAAGIPLCGKRKLIESTIDETDLQGEKTIILGTTHAPLKLPSTAAAFDRLV